MSSSTDAAEAVYKLITSTAKKVEEASMGALPRSAATANLALALRYMGGGAQPGTGPTVEHKA